MDVKNTLWNGTQNYSIRSNDGNTEIFCWQNSEKADILSYIILFIFLSAAPVAIYSLFIQVRNDPIFPVFMINLMISDLGHLCCMILTLLLKGNIIWGRLIGRIYQCVLMASAGFMVCVALERYLVIVFPVWYRFTRTVKIYLVLCVTVWFFSISAGLFTDGNLALLTLPFFLLLFFLIKTVKALSAVQSVPSDEKQRIVAILVTVVLIYLLIFFSGISLIIARMVADYRNWIHVDRIQSVFCCVTQFNPLLDLFLYFFMKEWAIDKLLAHLCCCRMDSNDISTLAA